MKIITECPSCGRHANSLIEGLSFVYATGVVEYRGRTVKMPPRLLTMLEHLVDAHPHRISACHLAEQMWPVAYGRPHIDTRRYLYVAAAQMRKALRDAGVPLNLVSCPLGYSLESVNEDAHAA